MSSIHCWYQTLSLDCILHLPSETIKYVYTVLLWLKAPGSTLVIYNIYCPMRQKARILFCKMVNMIMENISTKTTVNLHNHKYWDLCGINKQHIWKRPYQPTSTDMFFYRTYLHMNKYKWRCLGNIYLTKIIYLWYISCIMSLEVMERVTEREWLGMSIFQTHVYSLVFIWQWAPFTPLNRDTVVTIPHVKDGQGAVSIRKTVLPGMAIPMLKIRRPNGRLIFNMEIALLR